MFEEFNSGDKEFKFQINVGYKTNMELTPRILEVSEAFGLGVSETKEFSIFKNFNIGFNRGDVVFITGDSGGGKSTLLKELYVKLNNGTNCLRFGDITTDVNKPIIEQLGKSTDEAIKYLSIAGLNDAFIFLRCYKELSDGQKYRYKLAELLSEKPEFLFIDEFCANLDRTTAKVIAYNLQRACRRDNIALFVATTHQDILEDLNPSVIVNKKFMNEVELKYKDIETKTISFEKEIYYDKGTMSDYKMLGKYHYKNTANNFPYSDIIVAKHGKDLVGVVVFSPPFLQTKGRTIKFESKYSLMTKPIVSDINKLFTRVSRIIISPKYRGCGLGHTLLKESMLMMKKKKYVELINVMGKFNPFAEKAGMEKIEITEETDPPTIRLNQWLIDKGLKVEEIHNPKYWNKWVDDLKDGDKTTLVRMTGKVLHHPKIGLSSSEGRRAEVVKKENIYKVESYYILEEEIKTYIPKLYSGMTLYYIWENPNYIEVRQSIGDYL